MIHTVKGFSVVNEAEVDVFLEFSYFLYDPKDVGISISKKGNAKECSNYLVQMHSFHMLAR